MSTLQGHAGGVLCRAAVARISPTAGSALRPDGRARHMPEATGLASDSPPEYSDVGLSPWVAPTSIISVRGGWVDRLTCRRTARLVPPRTFFCLPMEDPAMAPARSPSCTRIPCSVERAYWPAVGCHLAARSADIRASGGGRWRTGEGILPLLRLPSPDRASRPPDGLRPRVPPPIHGRWWIPAAQWPSRQLST